MFLKILKPFRYVCLCSTHATSAQILCLFLNLLLTNNFLDLNIFVWKVFLTETFFWTEIFLMENIFDPNFFVVPNFVLPWNFRGLEFFYLNQFWTKYLRKKTFWTLKFAGEPNQTQFKSRGWHFQPDLFIYFLTSHVDND